MIRVIAINEVSIFKYLYLCLTGKSPYVLSVEAYFPVLSALLDRVVALMTRQGRSQSVRVLRPDLEHMYAGQAEPYLYNVFERIEPWLNEQFQLERADRAFPDYAYAYRNLTANYIRVRFRAIVTLSYLMRQHTPETLSVEGLSPSTRTAVQQYTGQSVEGWFSVVPAWTFAVANLFIGPLVLGFSLVRTALRIRPSRSQPQDIFFAADYVGGGRDLAIYDEVQDGGRQLMVVRMTSGTSEEDAFFRSTTTCTLKDGVFSFADGLATLMMIVSDVFKLAAATFSVDSPLFYQVVALPYRRALYRGLFNLYRPKYFWGRDDYNVEHIIRRQELHRIGGTSIGMCHSFPTYAKLFPVWRYISFDLYYIFGPEIYRYYQDTWMPDMDVVPVGAFGFSRQDYAAAQKTKGQDIGIFVGVFTNIDAMIETVRQVAEAFPERTVWLQLKYNYAAMERGKAFIARCVEGLPNVHYTSDRLVDIFKRISVSVSDPSTVVIEAIQFGLTSFMADVNDRHEVCGFRDFPGLCLRTPEEIVARLQAVESGEYTFDHQQYADLIDLSGQTIFDVLRHDMGLEPKAPIHRISLTSNRSESAKE